MTPTPEQEERANALTHGFGAVVSLVGLIALIVRSWDAPPVARFSVAAFGLSLVGLYTASTLYHLARRPAVKHRLRVLDHAAIYLLIAGSYTPFTLISLGGRWGWVLFAAVWTMAVAGVGFKLRFTGRFDRLSTALYLAMGWLVILAARPMATALPTGALALLVAGGLAYSLGVIFYRLHRLPYSHAVWHLFVLAGSLCHLAAVLRYVL